MIDLLVGPFITAIAIVAVVMADIVAKEPPLPIETRPQHD